MIRAESFICWNMLNNNDGEKIDNITVKAYLVRFGFFQVTMTVVKFYSIGHGLSSQSSRHINVIILQQLSKETFDLVADALFKTDYEAVTVMNSYIPFTFSKNDEMLNIDIIKEDTHLSGADLISLLCDDRLNLVISHESLVIPDHYVKCCLNIFSDIFPPFAPYQIPQCDHIGSILTMFFCGQFYTKRLLGQLVPVWYMSMYQEWITLGAFSSFLPLGSFRLSKEIRYLFEQMVKYEPDDHYVLSLFCHEGSFDKIRFKQLLDCFGIKNHILAISKIIDDSTHELIMKSTVHEYYQVVSDLKCSITRWTFQELKDRHHCIGFAIDGNCIRLVSSHLYQFAVRYHVVSKSSGISKDTVFIPILDAPVCDINSTSMHSDDVIIDILLKAENRLLKRCIINYLYIKNLNVDILEHNSENWTVANLLIRYKIDKDVMSLNKALTITLGYIRQSIKNLDRTDKIILLIHCAGFEDIEKAYLDIQKGYQRKITFSKLRKMLLINLQSEPTVMHSLKLICRSLNPVTLRCFRIIGWSFDNVFDWLEATQLHFSIPKNTMNLIYQTESPNRFQMWTIDELIICVKQQMDRLHTAIASKESFRNSLMKC